MRRTNRSNTLLEQKLNRLQFLRIISRGIMILGFVASAGGNVLHGGKTPVQILISLAAPVILMGAFELVSRIPLPKHRHWFPKTMRVLATAGIATMSAYISYFAQRDAIYSQTSNHAQAYLLPLAVDFLMVVGSISLIELELQIMEIEVSMDASRAKQQAAALTEPPALKSERAPNGRERFARALAKAPELSHNPSGLRELAQMADISYNYAFTLLKELKGEMVDAVA